MCYVEKLLIVANEERDFTQLKPNIGPELHLKGLSIPGPFFGNETKCHSKGSNASRQSKLISKLIHGHKIISAKRMKAMMTSLANLRTVDSPPNQIDHDKYPTIIGSFRHLAVHTSPDMFVATSALGSYLHQRGHIVLLAVERFLRYPAGSINRGTKLTPGRRNQLSAYLYADCGTVKGPDLKICSIIMILYGVVIVYPERAVQRTASISSTAMEQVVLSESYVTVIWWLQNFIQLHEHQKKAKLFDNNNGSTWWASGGEAKDYSPGKRIDIRHQYVAERVIKKQIQWVKRARE